MITSYYLPNHSPTNTEKPRIGVVGDLVLGSEAEKALADEPKPAWGPFTYWVQGLDLFILTFDSTFFGEDQKPWQPHVMCGENALDSIPLGKRTLFNIANNHIFDGGRDGFLAACKAFEKRGIATVGAGLSLEEAEAPWQGIVADYPITVFAAVHYGCHPRDPLPEGGDVARLGNGSWWERVAECTSQKDSLVLVLLHGGIQGSHYPSPKGIETSQRLVEMGVHAVIWSHAHVIQGVTPTPKGLIAYGLGNAMHLPLRHNVRLSHQNLAYDQGMFIECELGVQKINNINLYFSTRHELELFHRELHTKERKWFQSISKKINNRNYNLWWVFYRWRKDVFERSLDYLRRGKLIEQIIAIRWQTLLRLFRSVRNARADAEDV